jgi:hypothetical protein
MEHFKVKNLKCVMTNKTCRESNPNCPLYKSSDRYTHSGGIQAEERCRYQGVIRWDKELRFSHFVEAGER